MTQEIELKTLYDNGLSIGQIGELIHLNWSSTRRLLLRKGVVLRSRGAMTGEHNPKWSGGVIYRHGYAEVLKPEHPRARKTGYVKRAILVWEEANGRPFPEGMEPHHKNLVKDDDRPENIEPKTHSKHMRDHRLSEGG